MAYPKFLPSCPLCGDSDQLLSGFMKNTLYISRKKRLCLIRDKKLDDQFLQGPRSYLGENGVNPG